MGLDFYYTPGSAPCRAVQMTAKAVGVELNLKLTNLMAGEHLKPEYLKVNYKIHAHICHIPPSLHHSQHQTVLISTPSFRLN